VFGSTGKFTITAGDTLNTGTGVFQINGTTVTASAAELNLLDDATVTTAEINYLDLTTLGSSEDSKVASYGATGKHTVADDDTIAVASGGAIQALAGSEVIVNPILQYPVFSGYADMGQGHDKLDTATVVGVLSPDKVFATARDTLSIVRAWPDTDVIYFQFEFTEPSGVSWMVVR